MTFPPVPAGTLATRHFIKTPRFGLLSVAVLALAVTLAACGRSEDKHLKPETEAPPSPLSSSTEAEEIHTSGVVASPSQTPHLAEVSPVSVSAQDPPSAPVVIDPTDARVVPVGLGDAVIDFFIDASLNAWKSWKLDAGDTQAKGRQIFSGLTLDWHAANAGDGPTLRREFSGSGVSLDGYDHVVLSGRFPRGAQIQFQAVTDRGTHEQVIKATDGQTMQFLLPLKGDAFLKSVAITVESAQPGAQNGLLLWFGLRNQALLEAEHARWRAFAAQPLDVFLRKGAEPGSPPIYHLLTSRQGYEDAKAGNKDNTPLGLVADVRLQPYVGGANKNLFGRNSVADNTHRLQVLREKESGKPWALGEAAVAASLRDDADSLREVAKAAVLISLIPHWDVDFITDFPDASWTQGAFQQSMTSYQVALALDMAGPWLSPAGRQLILRRLVESGLNPINADLWKAAHRHQSNQLAVFTTGRLAVYAIMEKQGGWAGTASDYTDLAFREFTNTLGNIFNEDGGFFEGSGYLAYTLGLSLPSLAIYANARGKSFQEVAPEFLAGTDDMVEALRSTTDGGRHLIYINAGQGGFKEVISPSVLSVLAKIRPDGAAARMLAASGGSAAVTELWALPAPDLTGVTPDFFAPWILLPQTGLAASTRKLGNEWVKLLMVGNSAGKGHFHEDRGSFVLEFAGQTFAADPGGLVYSDADAHTMEFAQNHNMLVPVVEGTKCPAPVDPRNQAVLPQGEGHATGFDITLNAGVLWPQYYTSWTRSFQSSDPSELFITDQYEIKKGLGVEFLWHTPLPAKIQDGDVIIEGKRGRIVITPPAESTVTIDPPGRIGTIDLATIRFQMRKPSATLKTRIRLILK